MKKSKLLTGILAMLMATAMFTGCQKDSDETDKFAEEEPIQTILHEGSQGEPMEIDNVSVTLNAAYSSDLVYTDITPNTTIVFFELTITNNTDRPLSFQYITNYSILVDGETAPSISARAMMSITKQFGENAERFETEFEAGETRTGYVAMEIDNDFQEISFRTTPLVNAGNKQDVFNYTYRRSDLTPAPAPAEE